MYLTMFYETDYLEKHAKNYRQKCPAALYFLPGLAQGIFGF